jgi:hypothetical protein
MWGRIVLAVVRGMLTAVVVGGMIWIANLYPLVTPDCIIAAAMWGAWIGATSENRQ